MICDKGIGDLVGETGKQRGAGMHMYMHVHTHIHVPWESSPATTERERSMVCASPFSNLVQRLVNVETLKPEQLS